MLKCEIKDLIVAADTQPRGDYLPLESPFVRRQKMRHRRGVHHFVSVSKKCFCLVATTSGSTLLLLFMSDTYACIGIAVFDKLYIFIKAICLIQVLQFIIKYCYNINKKLDISLATY